MTGAVVCCPSLFGATGASIESKLAMLVLTLLAIGLMMMMTSQGRKRAHGLNAEKRAED